MVHATQQRLVRSTSGISQRAYRVCIVDPAASDAIDWEQAAAAHGVQIHTVATSAEALRISRSEPVDLWIVNANLPGLSGIELCAMLKGRAPTVPVYVMADEYAPAVEQAARQARATLFGVKPEHHAWLCSWAEQHAPRPSA